jgi:hypothetical protein
VSSTGPRTKRRVSGSLRIAGFLALIVACGGTGPASSGAGVLGLPSIGHLPRFSRVVVVVMENKGYGQIIGSAKAPYINSLANRYSYATNMYGTIHPSLPNYLALTGGDTFGITTNCTTCSVNAPNIVDQLEGAGISWKAYMEGMPRPCAPDATFGTYAKKHNPFIYYDDIAKNPSRCSKIVALPQLNADIQNGTLPTFVWVTPDMCHSMHDCTVATGDQFLSGFIPPLLDTLGSNGVLFLTWDEGSSNEGCCTYATGGHIATIVAGPGARSGKTSATGYDHYSILRTIESAWGLPLMGHAACSCSKPMTDLIVTKLL